MPLDEGAPAYALRQETNYIGAPAYALQQEWLVIGAPVYALRQETNYIGAPAYALQQEWLVIGAPAYALRQYNVLPGAPAYLLRQDVAALERAPSFQVRQLTLAIGAPALTLSQAALSTSAATAIIWRLAVILGGTDISTLITGDWEVDGEEGAARVARFSMLPMVGSLDLVGWIKKTVTIDFQMLNSAGDVIQQDRLFTGIVDRPEFDMETDLTTFYCTDNLQETINGADAALLGAAVGGYWSAHIFAVDATGWRKLQDRMSTVPASYDLDVYGTGRVTQWDSATVDQVIGESDCISGTRKIDTADARELHSSASITGEFRFQRLRQRDQSYRFTALPGGFGCSWLQDPWPLPQRASVESAVDGAGWTRISKITYTDVPGSRWFFCPGPLGWVNFGQPDLCIGANWILSKRWAQTITESYQVTVTAPQAVTALGEIAPDEAQFGVEAEQDIIDWEQIDEYDDTDVGSYTGLAIGEKMVDEATTIATDRAEFNAALIAQISLEATKIKAAHRRNYLTWETVITPHLDRSMRLQMTTAKVDAEGKIFSVQHSGSISTGEAKTEITLAISRSASVPVTPGAIAVPPPPNGTGSISDLSAIQLGAHVGGKTYSQVYNEEWDGYITNHTFPDPDAKPWDPAWIKRARYPEQFRVPTPEITAADRDELELPIVHNIDIEIPIDTLTITAG